MLPALRRVGLPLIVAGIFFLIHVLLRHLDATTDQTGVADPQAVLTQISLGQVAELAAGAPRGDGSSDYGPDTESDSQIELLIGVFTTAAKTKARTQIRNGWASSEVIRSPSNPRGPVVVHFVLGSYYDISNGSHTSRRALTKLQNEREKYQDMIFLDQMENMNGGKTFEWFRYAAHRFAQARYVAKVDDDMFIRPACILSILLRLPSQNLYWGRWTTDRWYRFLHVPIVNTTRHRCEPYMQGGLVVLSQDMAQWISRSRTPNDNRIGPEDLITGCWFRHDRVHVVSPLAGTKHITLEVYGERVNRHSIAVHTKKPLSKFKHLITADNSNKGAGCPSLQGDWRTDCLNSTEPRVIIPNPDQPYHDAQTRSNIFDRGCNGHSDNY